MLEHHKENDSKIIVGCDEAGAGCFAGAVFASAVVLPSDYHNSFLDDSKKMTDRKRRLVYDDIINNAIAYSIQSVSAEDIDEINILQARFKAMDLAIKDLSVKAELCLIDGDKFLKDYHTPFECHIKGDGRFYNIAGASVLAKVSKDDEMLALHEEFSMYSWNTNKSYGTKQHKDAIRKHGLSPYHRKSFNIIL
jgi:ribonuclease HII